MHPTSSGAAVHPTSSGAADRQGQALLAPVAGAGLALGPWGRADPRHSPEVWGVGRTLMGLGDTSTAGPGAGGQQAAELWP